MGSLVKIISYCGSAQNFVSQPAWGGKTPKTGVRFTGLLCLSRHEGQVLPRAFNRNIQNLTPVFLRAFHDA